MKRKYKNKKSYKNNLDNNFRHSINILLNKIPCNKKQCHDCRHHNFPNFNSHDDN